MTRPDRAAREAAALRANLLKRKDQTRQREALRDAAGEPQVPTVEASPPRAPDAPAAAPEP